MSRDFTHLCPYCYAEHDRASALVEKGAQRVPHLPQVGDVTLCIRCGMFSILDGDGMFRRLTGTERRSIARDPICKKAREAWITMRSSARAS